MFVRPFQALLILLAMSVCAMAQAEPLDWWGDVDGFINQQDVHTLAVISEAITQFPPKLPEPIERRMAMLMMDGVLHEEHAPKRPAVQQFFHARMSHALTELRETRVEEGARIWKLYSHSFIVRTASVTFAFDLVRAHSARAEGFAVSDALMESIVEQCDALFISHRHGDHADEWVASTFIAQGKPVIAPPEVWKDKAIHGEVLHLERVSDKVQSVPVQKGAHALRVVNYPGHQGGNIENNVPLVFTPEGMSFVQTGDQSNRDDFSWIDNVGKTRRVDVLMPNCWTTDIQRVARGFDPALIITGHENELGHTIDHRESNWLTYVRLQGSPYPHLLMTWGESFHYRPSATR